MFRLTLLTATIAILLATRHLAAEEHASAVHASAVQDLEDPPQKLAIPRDETQQDRLEALSLFAAGRTHQQREEYAQALKQFQRAARLDPGSTAALRELVPLAFQLNRPDVAVRYALKLVKADPKDRVVVRRLASYLAETGELRQSAELYELCLERMPTTKDATLATTSTELGRLYFLLGDFPQAAKYFRVTLQALEDPDRYHLEKSTAATLAGDKGQGYELLITAFLEAKQLPEAKRAVALLTKLRPDSALAAYQNARLKLQAGQASEALALLEQYLAKPGDSPSRGAYELLGNILIALNRSGDYLPQLAKMHAAQPANAPLTMVLAEAYRKAGQYANSRPIYEKLHSAVSTVQSTQALIDLDTRLANPEGVLKTLSEIVAAGGSLEMVPEDLRKPLLSPPLADQILAIAQRMAASPKPADFDSLQAAAMIAAGLKRYDQVATLCEAAIRARPAGSASVLLTWGMELVAAERYAEATAVFERGVKLLKASDPSKASFLFYQAITLEMSGKTEEALAAARAAAAKRPDDPRFASRIAWILMHAKRRTEAIQSYTELLKKFDNNYSDTSQRELMRDARQALAALESDGQHRPQAEQWLEEVLDEFPDDPGANNDLAYLWSEQGRRLRRSLTMSRLAVAAEPNNLAYQDTLGWVLFQLEQYPEAAVALKRAASETDPDGVVLDHYGDCLAKLGKTDEARAEWTKAAAAFKKANEAAKLAAVERKLAPPATVAP